MTAHDPSHAPAALGSHDAGHGHATRRGYLIGFLLSVVLTAVPFWLAMTGVLEAQATAVIVTLLALAQIVVHTIFFLHVNTKAEGGWTLLALVFTTIIVVIVILGSLWIMYHLHGNMMPMAPQPPPVV
ncbi:MAG TPA: cytochrome o ubiquinol oxidase subunit IV [Phenylobacterium sp.]|nr:cytochrome o ubiquinol oxidase subunit IV [Phenylobacterium sp.]